MPLREILLFHGRGTGCSEQDYGGVLLAVRGPCIPCLWGGELSAGGLTVCLLQIGHGYVVSVIGRRPQNV